MKFALVVCFAALAAAEPEDKPEAKADPWLTYGYAGYPYAYGAYRGYYGHPYAYYGKRSADAEPEAKAEADPALLYSTYGYAGFPYAYSGLYHGYAGYHAGYPYAYYGKRSADAEPEADALYGYYGYARPYYGYGYRFG